MRREEILFLDTNVFIDALEHGNPEARDLVEDAVARDAAATSVITLMEYCTGAWKTAGEEAVSAFRRFLRDQYIRVYRIDENVSLSAAKLRAENAGLKAMDALQLACAKENGCTVFCTNDRRLTRIKGSGLHIQISQTSR